MQPSPKCRNCGTSLITKQTKKSVSQLEKAFYYTAYYFCPRCQKMYLSNEFKVENTMQKGLFALEKGPPVDVEIWTDGACSNNGRPNAKAAWAFVSGSHEEAALVEGKQTNNTAESLAMYFALKWAGEQGYKKVRIYSDSQITIGNLQRGMTKIKVNRDIFQMIFDVIKEYSLTVYYEKVLGHSGDINNERADKLCNGLVGIK
ncbi:hypothetical protein BH11PAT1_BH11PAT1_0620 [soil metagenome]